MWERHLAAKNATLGHADRGKMPLPHKTRKLSYFFNLALDLTLNQAVNPFVFTLQLLKEPGFTHIRHRGREQERVDPIEQSAMTRQNVAGVFYVAAALDD